MKLHDERTYAKMISQTVLSVCAGIYFHSFVVGLGVFSALFLALTMFAEAYDEQS